MAANGLDLTYAYRSRKPFSSSSSLLNSFFMSTVNVAANSLVSVASNAKNELSGRKWRPADHFRFMLMLTSWFTVWVLRIVMDWFPVALAPSRRLLTRFCGGGDGSGSRNSPPLLLPLPSSVLSASPLGSSALASLSKLDLVPFETLDFGGSSFKPLTRALSQILAILNEMPASCQKYQFTMAMAEKMMEENARSGQIELLQVNRAALSAAFARTSSLLYDSLHRTREIEERHRAGTWPARIIAALPFGAYVTPYLKFFNLAVSAVGTIVPKAEPLNGRRSETRMVEGEFDSEVVVVEKLGQELVWMTEKLREYGAVDEAMLQWSFAGGLASVSVACSPRIQWCFVKISATLFRELMSKEIEEVVRSEVKFRMLSLWLPLLCHARNGLAFPALMRYEKDETERAVNQIVGTLSPMDQELILTNWLQDYAISASEWPNLQPSYDRWCNSTRLLAA
ncbi:uncharacterized protein LOC120081928 [Benincasa hispida]|uniref:uncharacterized protein LOC120081928 n=1 Tax=Benincasa hispida TaxID=102211 RepID=UPI001900E346|nr:uncharacterized protein LOC120081928 [Benincasa hispida]